MNKKWRDAFWGILLLLALFAPWFWLASEPVIQHNPWLVWFIR